MKYTKDFDLYLKTIKGTEEYLLDKSKAGTIGGSVGRNSPEHNRRLAMCMNLSKAKLPIKRFALCLRDSGPYERGKKYNIVINEGARISSPYKHQYISNYELASHWKLYKEK